MIISEDIKYIGVNDRNVDLFEGQYHVPKGMSYNSYIIIDEKIAVMDTVDAGFADEWLDNIRAELRGRKPDYLIIQHMEPDHSANIAVFAEAFPDAVIVSSEKAFAMMRGFFGTDYAVSRVVVAEGDTLSLGKHRLSFVAAPMVHWPEVIVTYDSTDKVLFSADGFGRFGALDAEDDWADEARRYYIGIVGKYGAQVAALLKKAKKLDISVICPLHGPVLKENLGYYLGLYDIWSSYRPESEGVVIVYTSVYGNTKHAVGCLADMLRANGCPEVVVHDLARCDMAEAVADCFRYSKIVLATTTYNAEIFPHMREFIHQLTERNFRSRTVAFIENGSWSPLAAKIMKQMLQSCKRINFAQTTVSIMSSLDEKSSAQLQALSDELCREYLEMQDTTADKNNLAALKSIGYGLYVITCADGERHNGLIVNTVMQLTDVPNRVAVVISKSNYSHHLITKSGRMNVNCLTEDAPFSLFENFGFKSGRNVDKFKGIERLISDNGLIFLPRYINAFLSLQVEDYVDFDTHGMFVCSVTEARVINDSRTMTYDYYHENVKPKPDTEGKKGFVCKVCGYVYEGDILPDDIICPLCKHGAADFEPIE